MERDREREREREDKSLFGDEEEQEEQEAEAEEAEGNQDDDAQDRGDDLGDDTEGASDSKAEEDDEDDEEDVDAAAAGEEEGGDEREMGINERIRKVHTIRSHSTDCGTPLYRPPEMIRHDRKFTSSAESHKGGLVSCPIRQISPRAFGIWSRLPCRVAGCGAMAISLWLGCCCFWDFWLSFNVYVSRSASQQIGRTGSRIFSCTLSAPVVFCLHVCFVLIAFVLVAFVSRCGFVAGDVFGRKAFAFLLANAGVGAFPSNDMLSLFSNTLSIASVYNMFTPLCMCVCVSLGTQITTKVCILRLIDQLDSNMSCSYTEFTPP